MGFFTSPPKPAASNSQQSTDLDSEKEQVFKKLTEELVQVREENAKLQLSHKSAVAERKEAVARMRELEDNLRLKERILDTLERRIENLELENNRLLSVETELSLLREDQRLYPLSASDANHRYSQLSEIFSQLRDTLSCAVCYEPYIKDQAVSLLCGHSFCRDCFSNWEQRHVEAWKLNPHQQGVYPGPDCPECRSREVRRGKVRIWALEETVRLVDRAVRDIEKNRFTPTTTSARPVLERIEVNAETEEERGREGNLSGVALERGEKMQGDSKVERQGESGSNDSTHPSAAVDPTAGSSEMVILSHSPSSALGPIVPTTPPPLSESDPSNEVSPEFRPPFPANEPSPLVDLHSIVTGSSSASEEDVAPQPDPQNSPLESESEPFASPLLVDPNVEPPPSLDEEQDSIMDEVEQGVVVVGSSLTEQELEEARNLLRPRTPNPYVAVFR